MESEREAQVLLEKVTGLRRACRELIADVVEVREASRESLGEGVDGILPVDALLRIDASLEEAELLARQLAGSGDDDDTPETRETDRSSTLLRLSLLAHAARILCDAIRGGFELWSRDR